MYPCPMKACLGPGIVPAAAALVCLAFGLAAFTPSVAQTTGKDNMQITSTAFGDGAPIPARYTGDGQDVSPPLKFSNVPEGTRSLALIADDPDAPVGTWVHWVLYNLPSSVAELAEEVPKTKTIAAGASQGLNDFHRLGYGGPSPPPGKPHRYFFRLYALDKTLELKPGATRKELDRAMAGHILQQAQWMGTYQR